MDRKNNTFIPALGYNWLTKFYDVTIKLTMPEKLFRNKLIDYLNPKDSEQILEFGFGTGQNLILAKERNMNSTFIGLDIDPKVKGIAQRKMIKKGADIKLDLYDGELFPYADNTFSKVFSSLVFHQLDRQTKMSCLEEINRVLKPGAELIVGDWGKPKSSIMRMLFYVVQILDGFETTSDNVKGFMIDYIIDAGFSQVKELSYINTKVGSCCYYKGTKRAFNCS